MLPTDSYFSLFAEEMARTLADLNRQEMTLASPTRTGDAPEDALLALQRLGHGLAGLAKTVRLTDFALLGATLETVLDQVLAGRYPIPRLIAVPITYLTVHIQTRLDRMTAVGRFLAPDASEMAEAERTAGMLRALVPEGSDAGDDAPESGAEAPFSADIAAIVDAFMQSELSRSAIRFLGSTGPIASPELVETLLSEFSEDVAELRHLLAELGKGQPPLPLLTQMSERAHKIKGSAHTAGAHVIGAVGEMMEDLLGLLRQNRVPVNDTIARWFIAALDALDALLARLAETGSDEGDSDLLGNLHEGYAIIMATISNIAPDATMSVPVREGLTAATGPIHTLAPAISARVDIRRLDRILDTLNATFINHIEMARSQAEANAATQEIEQLIDRLAGIFDRLRRERIQTFSAPPDADATAPRAAITASQLDQWRAPTTASRNGAAGDHPPDMESYSDFDLIMAQLGETLTDLRTMHLGISTALAGNERGADYDAYLTEALQRDVLQLRLVPLRDLEARLQLTARAVATEEGRMVEVTFAGGDIEIDSDIAVALGEPLTQLVRNAVVHGIEAPDERRLAGKDPTGHIAVTAELAGEGVILRVSDDGRGVSPDKLKASALLIRGPDGPLLTEEAARTMSDADILELMFLPDVTTAVEIRPAAGRGMGLPTVRRAVEGVRGTVSLTSTPEVGTTFTLQLPTTLSIVRSVIVRADANHYAVPLRDLARTAQVVPDAFGTDAAGRATVRLVDPLGDATTTLPVITLADLLDRSEIPMRGTHALVVALGGQEYAVLVDEFGDQHEMIVRRVPRHLRRQGVRGASIAANGDVLLILDLPRIIAEAVAGGRFGARVPVLTGAAPLPAQGDYILLVDDSPSVRQGLRGMLSGAGFTVQTARDGIEAISQIAQQLPRLLVLDVEMPHMNGYEVLEVLRAHPPYHGVRAIMLTSRSAAKYRDHALSLGAVDYLVKPITGEALAAAIRRAIDLSAPA